MTVKEKYYHRKSLGLCTRCGKEKDDDGFTICSNCREYQKDLRDLYKRYGVCPVCRENEIVGDEKTCLDCRAKKMVYNAEYRNRDADEYRANQRIKHKQLFDERKKQGLCARCGRKKGNSYFVNCERCRQDMALRARLKREVK